MPPAEGFTKKGVLKSYGFIEGRGEILSETLFGLKSSFIALNLIDITLILLQTSEQATSSQQLVEFVPPLPISKRRLPHDARGALFSRRANSNKNNDQLDGLEAERFELAIVPLKVDEEVGTEGGRRSLKKQRPRGIG